MLTTERIADFSGYQPRAIFAPYRDRTQRFSVGVAHRRAGKTVAHVHELIRDALQIPLPNPRCAYVAPSFVQAKDIAWTYLKQYALGLKGVVASESELHVDLPNGGRVRLYGVENAHRLRGLYFDHVVLDEPQLMAPSVWPEIVRPTLSDRHGKASFIGTPNGRNHFWELFDEAGRDPANWFRFELRASRTLILPRSELDAARCQMTQEQYEQEYECSFQAATLGAYYGADLARAEAEGRIGAVPYRPEHPVVTAWDLGIGDSTAIWFAQLVGKAIHLIDYVENAGVGLEWYAARLKERPYRYEPALLPHDAAVKELGTGRSRFETLASLGVRSRVLPRQSLEDGINAARLALARCWFDAAKCKRGLEALRQYRRAWDEKRRAFNDHPLHDWTSDAADAFRYLALGIRPVRRKYVDVTPDTRWVV